MRRVLQTRTGAPNGNCTAACLASIFKVPLDEVPDPRWPDDILWSEGQDKILTRRGHLARETRAQAFQDFLARYGVYSLNVKFDDLNGFLLAIPNFHEHLHLRFGGHVVAVQGVPAAGRNVEADAVDLEPLDHLVRPPPRERLRVCHAADFTHPPTPLGDFSTITYSDFDPSENTPSWTGLDRVPYKYPLSLSVLSIIHFLIFSAPKTVHSGGLQYKSLSNPVQFRVNTFPLNTLQPGHPPK